jgi:hypothetical protein
MILSTLCQKLLWQKLYKVGGFNQAHYKPFELTGNSLELYTLPIAVMTIV